MSGAIAVLFLFVIMMLNIKLTDILETGSRYTKNLPLALAIGSLFIYEIPIKPIPNNIKYPAALTNTEIKKITAITGFLEVITKTLEKSAANAKISIRKFFMIFIFGFVYF